jgi:hypothetical protein
METIRSRYNITPILDIADSFGVGHLALESWTIPCAQTQGTGDEAKIKAMTGGEPIVARFMRQNLFKFDPEFKLWLVANDRPRVRGTDDAFWRRVRVIPLDITIPSGERDPDLPNKLRAEWPGILAWVVRGCRKWQVEGLSTAHRRALGHEGLAAGYGRPEKVRRRAADHRTRQQNPLVPAVRPVQEMVR